MLKYKKYTFMTDSVNSLEALSRKPVTLAGALYNKKENKKHLKKEVMDIFQKYGYLGGEIDYEVNIRTTSGNVAWININSMETIK